MKNNEYFKNEHDGEAHGTNDDGKRIGSRGQAVDLIRIVGIRRECEYRKYWEIKMYVKMGSGRG